MHDDRVLFLRGFAFAPPVRRAADHRFDQRLFQPARGIGIGDNFWSIFR